MEKSEILSIALGSVGVLWGVVQSLSSRYANRQESDVKALAEKHTQLYEKMISTQKEFTESSTKLATAVDRLSHTVEVLENQSSERHESLNSRIDDLHTDMNKRLTEFHEADELIRRRLHWIVNKITALKFAIETLDKDDIKLGGRLKGDWDSP